MEREFDLLPLLDHIDPSILSYQEWINVGMALKHEGYTASDWDNWSLRDPARYRKFECFKKWDTFNEEAGSIVTGGTIVQLAKDHGWVNPYSSDSEGAHELDWNDTIDRDYRVIDKNWIEGKRFMSLQLGTQYKRLSSTSRPCLNRPRMSVMSQKAIQK